MVQPVLIPLTSCTGQTTVAVAAQNGHITILKLLIEHKADVNLASIKEAYTPVHKAVERNQQACVQVLLDAGANIHLADTWGNTAAHKAAQKNHVELLKILKASGANMSQQNVAGITPLSFAIENKLQESIDFLRSITTAS